MAVYKIFPERDATIYSQYPNSNTGIDEILELSSYFSLDGTILPSRTLIKFSQTDINEVLNELVNTASFQANLKLYAAKVTGLDKNITLETYPISSSWNQGTGQYQDSPQTVNGVSWIWNTTSGSTKWATGSYNYFTTASYTTVQGGGTWYTGSYLGLPLRSTASIGYRTTLDLNFTVTNIIKNWYSQSIGETGLINDGFLIKQTQTTEFNNANTVELKYFSIDTNTIYPPCLEFKWDDSTYNTSSAIAPITTPDLIVNINNNKGIYQPSDTIYFRLNTRPQNPPRVFSTSSIYTTSYYLPPTSTYSIRDQYTDEVVIDFDDNYTKISADTQGNYIKIFTSGLEPERYYKVLIKTVIDQNPQIIDVKEYFKIVNL